MSLFNVDIIFDKKSSFFLYGPYNLICPNIGRQRSTLIWIIIWTIQENSVSNVHYVPPPPSAACPPPAPRVGASPAWGCRLVPEHRNLANGSK